MSHMFTAGEGVLSLPTQVMLASAIHEILERCKKNMPSIILNTPTQNRATNSLTAANDDRLTPAKLSL